MFRLSFFQFQRSYIFLKKIFTDTRKQIMIPFLNLFTLMEILEMGMVYLQYAEALL